MLRAARSPALHATAERRGGGSGGGEEGRRRRRGGEEGRLGRE
jgi:hypothetical protein